MKTAQLQNIIWTATMGRHVKKFKYVGTESDKMEYGEYYTYQEIADVAGMLVVSIRNRMNGKSAYVDGEKVITDEILQPKMENPFVTLSGEKIEQNIKRSFPDQCTTPSEKMMAKHLRMRFI